MTAAARPLVTVMFSAHQQERFVREAIRSVLAQDYAPLEILASDDASTDRTFAIMQEEVEAYRGPSQVWLNRNDTRLRSAHPRFLVGRAASERLIVAHGDDVAYPHRVRRLIEAMLDTGAALVSSDADMIDARGGSLGRYEGSGRSRGITLDDVLSPGWQRTSLGAATAQMRALRTAFRPQNAGTPMAFDAILPLRAAMLTGSYFVGEPLLAYRRHETNIGNFLVDRSRSAEVLAETTVANELAIRAWILGDIEDWIARHGRSATLDRMEASLRASSLAQVDVLAERRLRLSAEGQAPAWVPLAEMHRRGIRPELARPAHHTGAGPHG